MAIKGIPSFKHQNQRIEEKPLTFTTKERLNIMRSIDNSLDREFGRREPRWKWSGDIHNRYKSY